MNRWPRFVPTAALALLAVLAAHAQSFSRRGPIRGPVADNHPPPTELIVSRWHFGTNGRIGHMGWSHNYPESEHNLNEFIARTTRVNVELQSYRLLELGSAEIFEYPFAYVSEPGEMDMSAEEVANLREYVERGGFVLIDDFDGDHLDNLRKELRRAFPGRGLVRLHGDEAIFGLVHEVEDLTGMDPYVAGGVPAYYALLNDTGDIAIVACHNNDLANFWEWYGSPQYPLKPSVDAFRLGANFVIQAFTH